MKHFRICLLLFCLLALIPPAGMAAGEPTPITMGETVTVDFLEFSVTGQEIRPSVIGSANAGRVFDPSEKSTYFVLTGTISNTGMEGFSTRDLRFDLKFNDKFKYTGEALVELDGWLKNDLDPLYDGKLCVVTTIPKKLVDQMETCTVTIGFNEGVRNAPSSAEEADYVYLLDIGKEGTEAAKDGPEITVAYMADCPALPDPTSLVSVRESGHSKSAIDGKQTRNEYRYSPVFSKDDGKKLFEQYLDMLPDYGCTVNKAGDTYEIIISGKQVADVTYDSHTMTVSLKPGVEGMKPASGKGSRTEAASVSSAKQVAVGGKITTAQCDMSVEKAVRGRCLYSDVVKSANLWHYLEAQDGNTLAGLYGTFRNKTGEPVDIRHIYCLIEFDGKYSYRGDVTAIQADGKNFMNDVSPMNDVKYYAYAEVPDSILSSYTTCVIRLGFTEGFVHKFTSSGGLPDFSKCNEVYEVSVSRGGFEPAAQKDN